MSDRPTIKLELPQTKGEVIIKEWLNGGEWEDMQQPLYDAINKGENANIKEMTHAALTAFVVSLNGSDKDILANLLKLPYKDYDFLISKINELKKKE